MKKLEGWGKKKLKYIVSIQKGKVPKEILTTNFNNELPVYLTMDYLRGVSKQIYYVPNFDKYIVVEDNEILLLWDGSNAGEFLWSKKGVLSSTMAVVKPNNEINKQFLFYRFKDFERYLKDITVGMGIPHVNPQEFLNFSFFIPSLNEQSLIANYLDRKTAEIDDLIAKKERLIELYEEEKRAIINKAVTKGLNPNVKMKDSGIPWLGEIPEHWEVVKFNHYVFLKHGYQFRDYDFTEDGIKVIKITQLLPNGKLDTENVSYIDEKRLDEFRELLIKSGDILMALTGGTIGKIIRVKEVNEPLVQNYRVGNFYPINEKLSKDFLFWLLSSNLILEQIFYVQRETGQPNIGKENFNKMIFGLPPKEEQNQIVEYIGEKITCIDSKIEKTKKMTELLKEYKTSLISEVVTGKRRVV